MIYRSPRDPSFFSVPNVFGNGSTTLSFLFTARDYIQNRMAWLPIAFMILTWKIISKLVQKLANQNGGSANQYVQIIYFSYNRLIFQNSTWLSNDFTELDFTNRWRFGEYTTLSNLSHNKTGFESYPCTNSPLLSFPVDFLDFLPVLDSKISSLALYLDNYFFVN